MSHHNTSQLQDREFDRYLTLSEKAARQEAIAADEAFAAAMNRAIRLRKVKVKAGTFVDHSPLMPARIRGYAPSSSCGSPGAMCVDQGE